MKTLIIALLFMVGNSCDSATKNTPELAAENPIESNGSSTTPPIQESTNPGEITVRIKVMNVYSSAKNICDIPTKNVMNMNVQEVLAKGSSIVNLPNKGEELLMNFIIAPKDLYVNSVIEAKATESLCIDASKTYFTIISYKIVE